MPKNKEREAKELQEVYDKIFDQSVKHMKKYEPQMVAGTLMAIAIRLYKTTLDDKSFHSMLQTVLDSEDEIRPYNDKGDDTLMARSRWINSSAMNVRKAVPETKLFTAVLSQAVHDAFSSHVDKLNKQAARNFLTSNNENLQTICEMAGRNSQYVCEKIRKKILREKGWNVDVTVDGCRKSYRKNKHLTLP